ncbi:hypothetical protein [Kitasatospora sp. NPDC057223]|uniref:hypothetical protein n=1 Tax=Kitasatospora sp. NPDC057223 TaxID=3346055 RepID=UPI00362CB5C6
MGGPTGILIALLLPVGCLIAVLALGRLEDRLLKPPAHRRHRAVGNPAGNPAGTRRPVRAGAGRTPE